MHATMHATQTPCTPSSNCCDTEARTVRPRADVYETEEGWLLVLDLPGADETTTNIAFEKNVLTITANTDHVAPEGFEQSHTEFHARHFERSFRLPDEVDRSAIDAMVKHGVLRLSLPKSTDARPQQVIVKGG